MSDEYPRENQKRLMIIGTGDVAVKVLSLLAHDNQGIGVTIVGREREKTLRAANMARLSAIQVGQVPNIEWASVDLANTDQLTGVISSVRPDVILSAVSLHPWHASTKLPRTAYERLSVAGFGPWIAMQLVPMQWVMKAVTATRLDPIVLNAAYPDTVNPVLAANGAGPDGGIGNVANYVPGIKVMVANDLNVEVSRIEVRFVAHHFVSFSVSRCGETFGAPFILRIVCDDEDVSDRFDAYALFKRLSIEQPRTSGKPGQLMTAASAVSVIRPLLIGGTALSHSPGFGGRVGGWPIRIDGGSMDLSLPKGISESAALEVNRDGQRYDGIESVAAGGTVRFTDLARDVMKRELGYTADSMRPEDAIDHAEELSARFNLLLDREWLFDGRVSELLSRL